MQPAGLLLLVQTLAPGRVRYQQALLGKIPGTQSAQFPAFEMNGLTNPRPIGILLGQLDRPAIHIKSLQGHLRQRLACAFGSLFHGILPELTATRPPLLEAIMLALGTRRPAGSDLCGFYQQGAGTAERVH